MTVRIVSLLIAFFLSLPTAQAVAGGKPLRVLTSFLPVYLFTKNVVGSAPGVSVDLTTYEDAMRNNLRVLQEVLGK